MRWPGANARGRIFGGAMSEPAKKRSKIDPDRVLRKPKLATAGSWKKGKPTLNALGIGDLLDVALEAFASPQFVHGLVCCICWRRVGLRRLNSSPYRKPTGAAHHDESVFGRP